MYVWTQKKNSSSMGMSNNFGPMITSGGYVQIPCRIRYESHGVVQITATYHSVQRKWIRKV